MNAGRLRHDFARRLASGVRLSEPVALVVAHADDETLWAGAALPRLADLTLIHVTDSSPRDTSDAARLGFASRGAYRDARAGEVDTALGVLGVSPRRIAYGFPDQEAVLHLDTLVERLASDLERVAAVLCHAYEGGHPDHDAVAMGVRLAVTRIEARTGRAPEIVEFAAYHVRNGQRVFGAFWPDDNRPEKTRALPPDERDRVARAIAAHRSQAQVIEGWVPSSERWRLAPNYDFKGPPPPGEALYDRFGWTMTSKRWREFAREALSQWA